MRKEKVGMSPTQENRWLVIFYSVPSRPVSNRMKLWRKLAKSGAVPLKGSVYVLPDNEEHYEFFEWLISEVSSMGGDGAFIRAKQIETLKESEVISLFNRQREGEYRELEKKLDDLAMKINSVKKGGKALNTKTLFELLARFRKEYHEIRKVDFFFTKTGDALVRRIASLEAETKSLEGPALKEQSYSPARKRSGDFQGRTWVTRNKPFVDRMASAWLIRRFIDRKATFRFIEEKALGSLDNQSPTFDIRGGDFTHEGDFCTFEVLVKSFGIKDKAVKRIAEIVHDLDVKDEKYNNLEASGVEEVLSGIRKTAKNDAEALERGMAVFEMLYASKS